MNGLIMNFGISGTTTFSKFVRIMVVTICQFVNCFGIGKWNFE
jgi:hypothetical protein